MRFSGLRLHLAGGAEIESSESLSRPERILALGARRDDRQRRLADKRAPVMATYRP